MSTRIGCTRRSSWNRAMPLKRPRHMGSPRRAAHRRHKSNDLLAEFQERAPRRTVVAAGARGIHGARARSLHRRRCATRCGRCLRLVHVRRRARMSTAPTHTDDQRWVVLNDIQFPFEDKAVLWDLMRLGTSVLIGHTHRAGVFHRTNRLGDHAAYENGCLCRLDGLGYANFPDWQQAFSVVDVFSGGMFNVTLLRILSRRCFIYGDTVVGRRS
jgi:hypothetical protein